MNVYKLTTQQNNLTVSEFHSFIRQNDVCNQKLNTCCNLEGVTVKSKNVPEDPAHFRHDTIWKVMWNGLLNRGLIIILTNLFSIKIAKEMRKSKRIVREC